MRRSAGRALINIARFALSSNPPQAHQGRADRSTRLVATGNGQLAGWIFTAARSGRCGEDSNQAKKESSSVKQTPRACANATVALEAGPDYLPKADADVRLRAVDSTHRRRLAFEGLCVRAEPIGLLGL